MGLLKKLRKRKQKPPELSLYGGHDSSAQPRILFVSHEATRTGAPKIILNILKHFHETTSANLQTILHSGGFLAEDFQRYSEVDCLNVAREASDELSKKVRKICLRHKDNPPVMAICNSMESRFIAYELHQLGIPITFLIHELPSSYEAEDYRQVCDIAERIIFPVEAVREAASYKTHLPTDRCMVLPQGLLTPDFAAGVDREAARHQLRREVNLPDDAFVVLGCGTLDLRKGIDHYCSVARTLLSDKKIDRPVHFVWLGEGERWTHSPYHYTMLDVVKSGTEHQIHFIGEREDVQPYFVGADTFLLTSRVDPFPCVLHEAMAAELPIITFDNSGGATESVSGGAGLVTPYGDYQAMADMIAMLANQPNVADAIRETAKRKVHDEYRFDQYADRIVGMAEQTTRCRLSNGLSDAASKGSYSIHRAA